VDSFMPRPLYPRGKDRGIQWIGGWVDQRPGGEKKKAPVPDGNRAPVFQAVA